MILPLPTLEMANGSNSQGLTVENEVMGSRANTVLPRDTTPPTTSTYLNYFSQLPYDPTNISNRFTQATNWTGINSPGTTVSGYGYTRLIARGDTVRSFVPNPNSQVGGDMRLIAAMPTPAPNQTAWPGDGPDLFAPLGSAAGTYSNAALGPYTSLFIRQLHSLLADGGNSRFCLNLAQTSEAILGSTAYSNITVPASLAGMGQSYGYLFPGEVCTPASAPDVTPELNGAFMDVINKKIPGDWTTGMGPAGDGPFITKPDEGFQGGSTGFSFPYFDDIFGNLTTTLVGHILFPKPPGPVAAHIWDIAQPGNAGSSLLHAALLPQSRRQRQRQHQRWHSSSGLRDWQWDSGAGRLPALHGRGGTLLRRPAGPSLARSLLDACGGTVCN